MSTTTNASNATIDAFDVQARELCVVICPYGLDFSEYHGTRAQLEAEGVIPEGTVWPRPKASLQWESGKFAFWLRRIRPEGLKGRKELWVGGDWWGLRWELTERYSPGDTLDIRRKAAELAAAVYRQSARGQAESYAKLKSCCEASADKRFQAFKALIPGLIPPKRGRKSNQAKAAAQGVQ